MYNTLVRQDTFVRSIPSVQPCIGHSNVKLRVNLSDKDMTQSSQVVPTIEVAMR
jgi:hypothetical protein